MSGLPQFGLPRFFAIKILRVLDTGTVLHFSPRYAQSISTVRTPHLHQIPACRAHRPEESDCRPLGQFRTVEVTALEKKQRQIEHARLTQLEGKFLSTLGHGAGGAKLFFGLSQSVLLSHHNPSSTFRTCDARARNAIGHLRIILRRKQTSCQRSGLPKTIAFRVSQLYAAWVVNSLTGSVFGTRRGKTRHCSRLSSTSVRPESPQDTKLCPFDGRSVRVYRTILSCSSSRRISSLYLRDSAWVLKSQPRSTLSERRRRPPKDR
jgi:hypothetical protein